VKSLGPLAGIDRGACAPVVYDAFDGTYLNSNGVVAYVIDPEGEYASMARAASGRVISPGVAGQGLNPPSVTRCETASRELSREGGMAVPPGTCSATLSGVAVSQSRGIRGVSEARKGKRLR